MARHRKTGRYQCPYCPSKIDGLEAHIKRAHPGAEVPGVPRLEKESYSFAPEADMGGFQTRSEAELEQIVNTLPADEFLLEAQVEEAAKRPRTIQGKTLDEITERRRIKLNRRLNDWLNKLTADPAVNFLENLAKARKQPAFTEIERETMKDGFDVLMEVIGLEFDIEPFIYVITSRWIALGFAPLVIAFTMLFRPGLVAERLTTPKKAEEKKS